MFTYYQYNKLRAFLGTLCFLSVIFAPWWVTLSIAIIICLRFRAWEVVAAGIFMDLYWMPFSVSLGSWGAFPCATLASIVILIVLEPLRRQLLIGPEII